MSLSSPPSTSPESRALGRWFAAARRSGFLAFLPPENWQTLSALLSFLSREGRCLFTLDQLAYSLGATREDAAARLQDLALASWKEQFLVRMEYDRDGEVSGAELPELDLFRRIEPEAGAAGEGDAEEFLYQGTMETTPHEEPSSELYAALLSAGLYPEQAERLLRDYPEERIRRQLGWLPARRARVPAALLVKAVEGDWGAPKEEA